MEKYVETVEKDFLNPLRPGNLCALNVLRPSNLCLLNPLRPCYLCVQAITHPHKCQAPPDQKIHTDTSKSISTSHKYSELLDTYLQASYTIYSNTHGAHLCQLRIVRHRELSIV